MSLRLTTVVLGALFASCLTNAVATAEIRPHGGMLRCPDISATQIVFVYADDLWLVPRTGGTAVPLASPPGAERFPRFSPDGQTIAFVGNYEGNPDLYTIPAVGGVATRVTHHPSDEVLCDWTADNRLLFASAGYFGLHRQQHLLTVAPTGGLPEKLPIPYGAVGAISPDGTWLAYTPYTRDYATWKRYLGGMASDLWLFNLKDNSAKKITDWDGTDSQPMWHGDMLYYMSDAGPAHRLNIWQYDRAHDTHRQITTFADFDVKWPAIGPGPDGAGEIVFQNGSSLYVLDLGTQTTRTVEVVVPGDRPTLRPQRIDVEDAISGWHVSPTGQRAVFEARGDIWTVPAHKGAPRNLTATSGVAERDPLWSPDGRWIVYLSDQTGEYELYLTQSDGKGETRQLTHDGHAFRYTGAWSPDSKHLAFTDKTGALYVLTIADGEHQLVDTDPWAEQPDLSWSHDSNWLAYTHVGDNRQSTIWLYNLTTAEKHQVTSGRFGDAEPTFDRKGDYLFFTSNREFSDPIYETVGNTFVYANTGVLMVVPLRADVKSPWAPESDEEKWDTDAKTDKTNEADETDQPADATTTQESETSDAAAGEDAETPVTQPATDEADAAAETSETSEANEADADETPATTQAETDKAADKDKPLVIDLTGFEARGMQIPVDVGHFGSLSVNSDNHLIYVRIPRPGTDQAPSINLFDLDDDDRKEQTVIDGTGSYVISGDGQHLLVQRHGTFAIVDAKPNQKFDEPMSLDGMTVVINPREEWQQLFNEAWRVQRDFFYDPHMHGLDWPAVRDQYAKMLADCVSRADVGFVISELISELNVGHAYYFSDDDGDTPHVSVGLLGVDFEIADGAYRIARIPTGGPWDVDGRGPLSQPGVDVHVGDYLLAVNGTPLDTRTDPWAAFQGTAGQTVTLTVSSKPTRDDDAREVLVKPIGLGRELQLRYRAWVEHNRAYVAERTAGRVAYVHVPDTGIDGQNELFRQFYGQRDLPALIVDERWNGGGQLPHRFIELLNRPRTNFWARRDGHPWPSPDAAQWGPKCMLINGLAGSGGDMFPYLFRQARLGKLIGLRTWGGLVGISGNPGLIDGAYVSVPTFAFYELDGTWGIEGHGVDPDIKVVDDPSLMLAGGDPQLDRAIEQMLTELQEHPDNPVPVPPYPDRSGMSIPDRDK